jgi:hypothetical protein
MQKPNVAIAAEYAVAAEICRRDFYAQVTLGNLKRTDILVFNSASGKMIRVEVKGKQEENWMAVQGTNDKGVLLVLVDFEGKSPQERPDYYLMDKDDWENYACSVVDEDPRTWELRDGYIPVWKSRSSEYRRPGVNVPPDEISQHKEKWEKLTSLLSK